MGLKLFYDLLSQPSRACYIFLKVNNIPFLPCPIALLSLERRVETFSSINPFEKIPTISDNGFILTESSAILKYLALQYKTPEHWYPSKNYRRQVRIDEYLHWHHFNVRWNGAMFFANRVVKPLTTGLEIDKYKVTTMRTKLLEVATLFEQYFIGQTPFISSPEISIADLQALVEFMQPVAGGFDIFAERPRLAAWRKRVEPLLQPHFDETHAILFEVAKRIELFESNQPMI